MTGLPEPSNDAARLLAMAQKDLRALEGMLDAAVFSEEIFGFHVEQAAEKLLKAWIASIGLEFPRTHDLGRLFRMVSDQGIDITPFVGLAMFTAFGVQFRYEAYEEVDDLPIDRGDALASLRLLLLQASPGD